MSRALKKEQGRQVEIKNSKVYHKYFVESKFEAGLILKGTEVKSIRSNQAQIGESFVRILKMKPVLFNAYIDEYAFGNIHNHDPRRPRALLLHQKEIHKLRIAVETEGFAIIPTRMYIQRGLVKIEIAICKGKKLFDKRHDLKEKTDLRDADRALKYKNIR